MAAQALEAVVSGFWISTHSVPPCGCGALDGPTVVYCPHDCCPALLAVPWTAGGMLQEVVQGRHRQQQQLWGGIVLE